MKNFTIKIKLTLFLLLFSLAVNAQTVNPHAIDGEIYLMTKKDFSFKSQGVDGKVSLSQLPFLNGLKESYKLYKAVRPFYYTGDSVLKRTYLLYFSKIKAVDSLIAVLRKNPDIVYAEKAPLFKAFYTPNDPYFNSTYSKRWYLSVIHAQEAWDIQKGNRHVVVAVLDDGVDIDHPDLQSKIVSRVDLADNDLDPTPPEESYDWTHGTHVAGLAGAATDNGIGIASIGFNVGLMAVKVASDTSSGENMTYGYQGIVWAADHGADVINMSWGGPGYYQTGQNIVNYAYNKGCVLVAAAGNDGNSDISYPAGYHHVISVASTDGDDKKSSFSQYGSTIDVCAPGGQNQYASEGIYSTFYTTSSAYGYMQGTSMASPIVSGLCGLMLSEDSTLTPEKLTRILKATCDNIDAQNPDYVGELGAGRINAYQALLAVKDSMMNRTVVANFKVSKISIPEGDTVHFTDLSIGNPTSWYWTFEGGTPEHSTEQNPPPVQYDKAGSYKVTLTVSDGTNTNTEVKTNYVLVYPLISGAWQPQATGFSTESRGINYIYIVNPDVVWANAYDGTGKDDNVQEFTKTTDGGNTWKPGKYTGVPYGYAVSCIAATDSLHAWIAMYNRSAPTGHGGVYVTTDGGKSWSSQPTASFSDAASFPDIIYFWDNQNGVCMGDPVNNVFEIYTTTDGGANWVRVPSANIPVSLSGEAGWTNLYAVEGNTIWFGTNKGRIYRSVDKGYHWTVASTGMDNITSLGFHNDTLGVAAETVYQSGAITAFHLVKTEDGGKTWSVVQPSGAYFKSDLAVVPGAPGWLVSTGISSDLAECGSAYSLDEGKTWTQLDDSIQYTAVKFYNSATGWAGGFNVSATSRGIWKWLGIPATGVRRVINNNKVLVYPNPASGKVHFHVTGADKVTEVSIYNESGKNVGTFRYPVGREDVVLDLKKLKEGIYIAVLKGKRIVAVKKIILK